jgi:hypothetical protein
MAHTAKLSHVNTLRMIPPSLVLFQRYRASAEIEQSGADTTSTMGTTPAQPNMNAAGRSTGS